MQIEVDGAGQIAEDVAESAGVTDADLGPAPLGGVEHVVEVGLGEGDPAGFDLDANGAAAEQGGLDDGGADAGHHVDHEHARGRVLSDDAPGQLGQHLGRMGGALGQVAPGPLVLGGGLGHRPDGQRHGWASRGGTGAAGGGGCGHGRCPRPAKRHL